MLEAGFDSRKSFARAVLEESRRAGEPLRHCDHTYVGRWLEGKIPRGKTPVFIAAALTRALGRRITPADFGMPLGGRVPADTGFAYPETSVDAIENLAALWGADLEGARLIRAGQVDRAAWSETSLRWLVNQLRWPDEAERPHGPRVGMADVDRFRATIDLFVQLDNRFGGGHARLALVQYLRTDGQRLLGGRYSASVGRALFSAAAEGTLLAAWMTYDSMPTSGLAQRYFTQALALAQSADDRLLGASILDAMSHQATYVGRYREAANLARAAMTGTRTLATPGLTAHFHAMEARALARLGDARACDLALVAAVRGFERRKPDNEPPWFQYFDEAELAAELGHCFRDLGRATDASQHASQCLDVIDESTFLRSDFFAAMVLADAYVAACEIEQACRVALNALALGEQLRSARCVRYLREFRARLAGIGPARSWPDFYEQARGSRLWRIASAEPTKVK